MVNKVSRFRSPEDEAAFQRAYDEILSRHWPPIPREELEVASSVGTTTSGARARPRASRS